MELSLELARDAELKTNAEQLHTNIKAFREFMEQICEPLNTRYEDIGNIPQREYTALKIIQIVDQLKQQYSSPLSTVLDNSFVLTRPERYPPQHRTTRIRGVHRNRRSQQPTLLALPQLSRHRRETQERHSPRPTRQTPEKQPLQAPLRGVPATRKTPRSHLNPIPGARRRARAKAQHAQLRISSDPDLLSARYLDTDVPQFFDRF